ncbi:MAG TPA: hypothetical protein VMH20_07405, partial [Verrucomicrobiae bacterium]|nr:hypothetical protein [Verrucomicrobiae bacterium]
MPDFLRKFSALLTSAVFLALPIYGQDQSPTPQVQDSTSQQEPPKDQKLTKEQKQKMKKTLKELEGPYKTWLNEDVVYIIS